MIESHPLNFYQVVDGAVLIAISKSERKQIAIWSRMSSDIANKGKRLGPKMSREIARLRDVRFSRIENSGKPSTYKKIMSQITDGFEGIVTNEKIPTVLSECDNDRIAPSEDPLPVLW